MKSKLTWTDNIAIRDGLDEALQKKKGQKATDVRFDPALKKFVLVYEAT